MHILKGSCRGVLAHKWVFATNWRANYQFPGASRTVVPCLNNWGVYLTNWYALLGMFALRMCRVGNCWQFLNGVIYYSFCTVLSYMQLCFLKVEFPPYGHNSMKMDGIEKRDSCFRGNYSPMSYSRSVLEFVVLASAFHYTETFHHAPHVAYRTGDCRFQRRGG